MPSCEFIFDYSISNYLLLRTCLESVFRSGKTVYKIYARFCSTGQFGFGWVSNCAIIYSGTIIYFALFAAILVMSTLICPYSISPLTTFNHLSMFWSLSLSVIEDVRLLPKIKLTVISLPLLSGNQIVLSIVIVLAAST